MPTPTPVSNVTELKLSVTLKVSGAAMSDDYALISANIVHEINKISFAEVIITGDAMDPDGMPLTDGSDFNPGNEIEILAGFANTDAVSIFKGSIVKHGLEVTTSSLIRLKLTCKHDAVSMAFNKTESEFGNQTDSAAISAIFGNYSTLTATVDSTSSTQENIFQKMATDWDFVLSRADFLGYIVTLDDDGIFVGKPKLSAAPVLKVTFGESILAFSAELNAEKQAPSLDASAWDIKTQALIKATATEPGMNAQGDVTAKSLSGKLSQKKMSLSSATPMASEDLKAWADSNLLRMRLSALKGQVTFIGNGLVKTGKILELEGVGSKFNGKAFVSSVNHILEPGNWKTKVKFGLDARYIHERANFLNPPAGGQLPAINGLHVATVQKISEDPQSQYRILVNIPSNSESQTGFWARLSSLYATAGAGTFFFPEVGDEVIVGFMENDPRYPVILGSMHSSKMKPPVEPADNNNYIKSIVTKAQLTISFDDENKIITIVTPGKNSITIDDKNKGIEIKDQNNNIVKLSSSGIDLTSDKDVTISAQNVNISAKANFSVDAKSNAELKGLNVNLTANMALSAKGTTTELNGSGTSTIKGAMVMIN